jgi:4-amino-4-deoxy-L-arabinose transferase-like glycosyltransferase
VIAAPPSPRGTRGDTLAVTAAALLARLAVVAWAAARFPPAADGTYYQRIAERLSQGFGYTWRWPDGVTTYAAHYPVGYPAMVAAVYTFTGAHPAAAMVLNAFLGTLAALAVHRLAVRAAPRRLALAAGLLVAFHPGLVAYTPALMTEGVTASLLASAAAVAAWARDRAAAERPRLVGSAVAIGLVVGVATLVRPQSLLLAPVLGLLAAIAPGRPLLRRGAAMAGAATLSALLVCAPWTARNCVHMRHCALVSVNGGWNLLIGADAASTGAWSPIKVPDACREVFDEAQKDVCFGAEARRYIAAHPATWLSLVPRKLAATFDYAGAAGWYLHDANPTAFTYRAKVGLGGVETLFERVALLFALAWAARADGGGRRIRLFLAVLGGALAFTEHGWLAYAALAVVALRRGPTLWTGPLLGGAAVAVLVATMATHAVFFGAGRYSMVVFPLLTALAPLAFARASERRAELPARPSGGDAPLAQP